MLLVVQYGLGGLGVMWLPTLVPLFGAGVLFLALTAFSAVALAMLPFIPAYPPRDAQAVAAHRESVERRSLLLVIAALAAMFLFQAWHMGLGAFVFGLARRSGLGAGFPSDAGGDTN